MKTHRRSAELNWIKQLQTPFPLGLNDQIYQQGNIWAGPSEKGAYGFSNIMRANDVDDVIYDVTIGNIQHPTTSTILLNTVIFYFQRFKRKIIKDLIEIESWNVPHKIFKNYHKPPFRLMQLNYHLFAPTLTSSHWNQMFTESVDLMVCVAIVHRGEHKDLIGHWTIFCELPTVTVGMRFYLHSLLLRYLDLNKSWIMQIAEINDIQIDLDSIWLWLFRLINSFPAYHGFLQKHSSSKLNSLIKVWTYLIVETNSSNLPCLYSTFHLEYHLVLSRFCLIFPTFSEITESHLKSHSISIISTLLLFVISTKKTIRNIIFNYNQVTSDPDVRSSIQYSCSCADSPFLYPPAGKIVTGDITYIPDKGLRSLFEKRP